VGLWFLPFVIIPILELALFIAVGDRIGVWNLVAIIVVTGFIGAWVASRQGSTVWFEARRKLDQGGFPGAELAHGAMVLVGAALLITPGFLTDVIGFLLMIPAVRDVLRRWGMRRFSRRLGIIDIEP